MNRVHLTLLMVIAFCLMSGAVLACHSNYFDDVFLRLEKQNLTSNQLDTLWKLRKDMLASDHRSGKCDRAHDSHKGEFLAAAAGVLNDAQYESIAGRAKTEAESLRYEIRVLKAQLAELKARRDALRARK